MLCVGRQIFPPFPELKLCKPTGVSGSFWKMLATEAGRTLAAHRSAAEPLSVSRLPGEKMAWRLAGGGLDQKAAFTGLAGPESSHVQLQEEEKGAGFSGNFHSLQ